MQPMGGLNTSSAMIPQEGPSSQSGGAFWALPSHGPLGLWGFISSWQMPLSYIQLIVKAVKMFWMLVLSSREIIITSSYMSCKKKLGSLTSMPTSKWWQFPAWPGASEPHPWGTVFELVRNLNFISMLTMLLPRVQKERAWYLQLLCWHLH